MAGEYLSRGRQIAYIPRSPTLASSPSPSSNRSVGRSPGSALFRARPANEERGSDKHLGTIRQRHDSTNERESGQERGAGEEPVGLDDEGIKVSQICHEPTQRAGSLVLQPVPDPTERVSRVGRGLAHDAGDLLGRGERDR